MLQLRVQVPALPFPKIERFRQVTLFYFKVAKLSFIMLYFCLHFFNLFSRHHFLDGKRFHSLLGRSYFGLKQFLSPSHECSFSFFSEIDIRFLNLSISLLSLPVKTVVEWVNVSSTLSFFA